MKSLLLSALLIILITFELVHSSRASNPCRLRAKKRQSESEESDENEDCDRKILKNRPDRRRNTRKWLVIGNSDKSWSGSRERSLSSVDNFYEPEPWWSGPNVCKRNELTTSSKASDKRLLHSVTSYSEYCRDSLSSRRCSSLRIENGTATKNTTIYECCLGFRRAFYTQYGCPEELKLNSTEDALRHLNLTLFFDAAKQAGLFEKMTPENNYTIFAPSNSAFEDSSNSADISFVTLETKDKMKFIRDILASHVMPQLVSSVSFEDGAKWSTLKNDAIIRMGFYGNFFRSINLVTANCARVTKMNYQTKNAYVHVVDRLMPEATRSLLQLLNDDARFSIFVSLLDDETRKWLGDPDRYMTVLAFTDENFEKLPQALQQKIQNKQSCMIDLAENHMSESALCSTAFYRGKEFLSLNSHRLLFDVSSDTSTGNAKKTIITVNGRRIIDKDKAATNGVLHIVDGPIFSSSNSDPLDLLSDLGYKEFSAALNLGSVTEFLSAHNDTIIFVPSRPEIEKILALNDTDRKNNLLLNHVARISDSNPSSIETLANQQYKLRQTSWLLSEVFFGEPHQYYVGCTQTYPYKSACNGVIQQIRKPLPLVASNVMELLRNNSDLSDFTFMVEASGLDKLIKESNGSFTIFAPDNTAMQKYIKAEEKDYLLQETNQNSLKRFIQRHIVRGGLCCSQFGGMGLFGLSLRAMDGSTLPTSGSESNRNLRVSYAHVRCDGQAQAFNGLVHIIDMPLARVASRPTRISSTRRRWTSDSSSASIED